jgi:rhodanese-related sulfurtransferase
MRKRWSVFSLLLVLMLLGGTAGAVESQEVPRMSIDELRAQLGNQQLVVLDVRSGYDWQRSGSKIAGAVRAEPATIDWAHKYDKNQTLVLYCA